MEQYLRFKEKANNQSEVEHTCSCTYVKCAIIQVGHSLISRGKRGSGLGGESELREGGYHGGW